MEKDKMIPMNVDLHLKLKVYCAKNGLQIKKFVEELVSDKLKLEGQKNEN
jgi:hypothetical protein